MPYNFTKFGNTWSYLMNNECRSLWSSSQNKKILSGLGDFCLYDIVDLTLSHNMLLPWLGLPANIHNTNPLLPRHWLLANEIFSPKILLSHFHATMLTDNGCMHNPVFISFVSPFIPYLTYFYSVELDTINKSAAAYFTAWWLTCPNECSPHPQ